jgi:hypothetical protein
VTRTREHPIANFDTFERHNLVPRGGREARLSYAGECLEKARLSPGDLDLWTVAPLRMKPAIDARLDTFDELQINDLAPIRTEELGRIEALLDGHQTSG